MILSKGFCLQAEFSNPTFTEINNIVNSFLLVKKKKIVSARKLGEQDLGTNQIESIVKVRGGGWLEVVGDGNIY